MLGGNPLRWITCSIPSREEQQYFLLFHATETGVVTCKGQPYGPLARKHQAFTPTQLLPA